MITVSPTKKKYANEPKTTIFHGICIIKRMAPEAQSQEALTNATTAVNHQRVSASKEGGWWCQHAAAEESSTRRLR